MKYADFLEEWKTHESVNTADVLASFLPLVRETLATHKSGCVAPLEGIDALNVDQGRIWFEEKNRMQPRAAIEKIKSLERQRAMSWNVVSEYRRDIDIDTGEERIEQVVIRPVNELESDALSVGYLAGYFGWEHRLEHHDPTTDIFSLGMILASLALQVDFREESDLTRFVENRKNLFAINRELHPVIAQAIVQMTELFRTERPQDLETILRSLENYRDQTVALEVQLALDRIHSDSAPKSKREMILTRLRDRLFDVSRRNPLLSFRATSQALNLTQASMPLSIHVESIREDQIFVWNEELRAQIVKGSSIRLNQLVNVNEAVYVPSVLERLMSDARRDKNEYGCSQLRLVVAFMGWANLKEKPHEKFVSPLLLVPVQLTKQKGIRDKYSMQSLDSIAEINPVIRHLFRQLYDIVLPESIDLANSSVDDLYQWLQSQIAKSEPAVSLAMVNQPQVGLIHEKAKRRLDQYRRSSRVTGRGASRFEDIDYSYDAMNYHPLGVRLFSQRVKQPGSRLQYLVSEQPAPRKYMVPPGENEGHTSTVERKIAVIQDANDQNPYHWTFDLCNQTLVNLHYRRMSLVRDYDAIVQDGMTSDAFEAGFSDQPRPITKEIPETIPLEDRFEVVISDPTQSLAIAEARAGRSYIIQGPPGTGKSQTITNLIADFVARGKRVLFVCEKRAAIDVVFARLKQSGLDKLCTVVHDSQSDKKDFVMDLKATYDAYVGSAGEERSSSAPLKRRKIIESLHDSIQPLQQYEEAMETTITSSNGAITHTIRELIDRCVEMGSRTLQEDASEPIDLPSIQLWWDHQSNLRKLQNFVEVHCSEGVFSRHPLRLVASSAFVRDDAGVQLRTSAEKGINLLKHFDDRIKGTGIPITHWSTFEKSEQLLDYFDRVAVFANDENLQLLEPYSNRSKAFEDSYRKVVDLQREYESHQADNHRWKQRLTSEETKTALTQLKMLEPKMTRWFSPTWWRLRAIIKSRYDFSNLAIRPTWTATVEGLEREYEAERKWRRSADDIKISFRLSQELGVVVKARDAWPSFCSTLPPWIAELHQELVNSSNANESIQRSTSIRVDLNQLREVCNTVLECWETLTFPLLQEEMAKIRGNVSEFARFRGIAELIGELPFGIRRMLRISDKSFSKLESDIEQNALNRFMASRPEVERFTGIDQQTYVARLEQAMEPWHAENAAEICRSCCERFRDRMLPNRKDPAFTKRYQNGRKLLEHEFGKSMRYRPIRELVDGDSGLVVKDLKPIWLMSPLSVADTLPLDSSFVDVVIFDEASQVRLEEAIPSLFRGTQTIIVGDTMQLPPTNFFAQNARDETEELEEVSESGDSDATGFDISSDSLLSHASKYMESTMLGWHYRSRSESLINFSNWAFYDGRLLTVPDTRIFKKTEMLQTDDWDAQRKTDTVRDKSSVYSLKNSHTSISNSWMTRPLTFQFCEDGVYDKRCNRREAECIAELVAECLAKEEGLTIGVIAFSEAQQTEIEQALASLADKDEMFRQRYEAELTREENGQFVGLLVKNLENIQGDERDVILLSVCYGPNPQGKLSMNFGPINRNGGEKRLNVAFSRAKKHMVVVTSMKSSQITNDYNFGPQCLKQYLRYVECMADSDVVGAMNALRQLSKWQSGTEGSEQGLSPVIQQIADALRAKNFLVDTQIGQSHFQIDIAVYRPGDESYRLGILVDTVAAYGHSDPWERDVMRPQLLKNFGWKIHRVLGKDWHNDSTQELDRILKLLV